MSKSQLHNHYNKNIKLFYPSKQSDYSTICNKHNNWARINLYVYITNALNK